MRLPKLSRTRLSCDVSSAAEGNLRSWIGATAVFLRWSLPDRDPRARALCWTGDRHLRSYCAAVCGAIVLVCAPLRGTSWSASSTCVPARIVVDTTLADTALNVIDGEGFGETVLVADTVVTAITFWLRSRPLVLNYSAIIYVTSVDSTGRPSNASLLYVSDRQNGIIGGPTTFYVPVTVRPNPPLLLPGPGQYYFNLSEASCQGHFLIAVDSTNSYAAGHVWGSGTTLCLDNGPGGPSQPRPKLDLVMDIEFCDTHSTPKLARTWGQLKEVYR